MHPQEGCLGEAHSCPPFPSISAPSPQERIRISLSHTSWIRHLLQLNKILQNVAAENNTHFLSPSIGASRFGGGSAGLGSGSASPGRLWASHQPRPRSSQGLTRAGRPGSKNAPHTAVARRPRLLPGYWQDARVPWPVQLRTGLKGSCLPQSEGSRGESERRHSAFMPHLEGDTLILLPHSVY